ncbi:MAG: translocation/assembly module TamB domain-containing protein [Nitrospirae bacterium]|nr:translocation/assembly module TamB domain-containing protein [Nitrospirota bacterium]
MGRVKLRRVLTALVVVLLLTYLSGVSYRYASGRLKEELVSQLKKLLDRDVNIDEARIVLFPPSVHLTGLTVASDKRQVRPAATKKRLLYLGSADVYVSLLPLLYNKLVLQKVFVANLAVDTSLSYVQEVIDRQKKKPPQKKIGLSVELRSLSLRGMSLKLHNGAKDIDLSLDGLKGQMLPGMAGLRLNLADLTLYSDALKPRFHERLKFKTIALRLKATSTKDIAYDIEEVSLKSDGLDIQGRGKLRGKSEVDSVVLQSRASVKMAYLKRLLGLKNPGAGEVSVEGPVDYDTARGLQLALSVGGSLYVETLLELIGEREPITGDVSFKGNLNGSLGGQIKNLRGEANATLKKGSFYGVETDSLSCKVIYDGPTLRFITKDARLYNGNAQGEVTLDMPVVKTFTVDIKAEDVDSKPVFKLIKWDPGLSPGKVRGSVYSRGPVFNPSSGFVYKTTPAAQKAARLNNADLLKRVNEVSGRVDIVNHVVDLHDIVAKTEYSQGRGNGVLDLNSNKLQMNVDLNTRDIVDLTKPSTNRLTGSGGFTGNITGTGEFPLISGTVRLDKGNFWGIDFTALQTQLRYSRELLEVRDGTGLTYAGNASFAGAVHFKDVKHIFDFNQPALAFDVAVREADVQGLSQGFLKGGGINGPKILGKLNTTFSVSGPLEGLRYAGDIDVRSLEVAGYPAGLLHGLFVYRDEALTLQRLTLKTDASEVSASIGVFFKGMAGDNWQQARYKVTSEGCLINEKDIPYAPLPQTQQGETQQGWISTLWGGPTLQCQFSGEGTPAEPSLVLEAWAKGTKTTNSVSGAATVRLTSDGLTLKAAMLDGNVNVNAKVALLSKDMPWSLEGTIKRNDYAQLAKRLAPNLPQNLRLTAQGGFSFSGNAQRLKGRLLMSTIEGAAYEQAFSNTAPIDVSLDGREVKVNSFVLTTGQTSIHLTGSLVAGRSYNLAISGKPKLNLLRGLSDKISWLNGEADVDLSIVGNWQRPQLTGGIDIKGATLGITNIRHYFNDISAYMYCDVKRCVVKSLKTNFGGGALESNGVVYLDGLSIRNFYMEGNLKNMPAYINDGFKAYLDGSLYYSGNLKKQTLSGSIKITKARYTKDLYLQELILANNTSAPLTRLTTFKTLELNVNLYGNDNIAIENNVIESMLKVDLLVKGTASNPILYGRIQTDRGKVLLQKGEFDLIHASVDFTGQEGFDPFINVLAETTVRGYDIRLIMDGQLTKANIALSSFPVLTEKGILSLLSDAGTSTLLTTKYQSLIEERLKTIGGLSRIQLTPSYDEDKSTITPQITISKKFLKDKLNLSVTTTSTKGDTIKAQYLLNRNISLLGERNELGRLGADVNFRYEFK